MLSSTTALTLPRPCTPILNGFSSLQVDGWGYFLILPMNLQHVSPKLAHISLSGNQLLLNSHGLPQTMRSHSSLLERTRTVSVPRSFFTYKFDICNHHVSLMRQMWTSEEQWTNSRTFYTRFSMPSTLSQLQYLPHGISYIYPIAKASRPSSQAILPALTLFYSQSSLMNPYSLITDPSRVQKHTQPMYSAPTITRPLAAQLPPRKSTR